MTKTPILMAVMLAVATVLAVGLTVLPSSVQEAHAQQEQLCTSESNNDIAESEAGDANQGGPTVTCEFFGNQDFTDEESLIEGGQEFFCNGDALGTVLENDEGDANQESPNVKCKFYGNQDFSEDDE